MVCAQKFDELSDKKKTLSEKVLKEQCKTAFEKFDKVSARSGPINRLPCRLYHRALTTVPPQDGSGSLDVKEFEGVVKACGKNFTQAELDEALAEIDADKNGTVNYEEFEAYWLKTFTGELVEGTNLSAVLAAWTDLEHIEGVAYHPDRYVDPDDEFRARVWYVFDEIDNNHDKHISYIEFIK